jgi:hypothetical protein
LQLASVATLNISPVVAVVDHTAGGTTPLESVTHLVQLESEASVAAAPDPLHLTTGLGQELVTVNPTPAVVVVVREHTETQTR